MDKPNYFLMNPFQRFFYKAKKAIVNFPSAFVRFFANVGKGIANFFVRLGKGIGQCVSFVSFFWVICTIPANSNCIIGFCFVSVFRGCYSK